MEGKSLGLTAASATAVVLSSSGGINSLAHRERTNQILNISIFFGI